MNQLSIVMYDCQSDSVRKKCASLCLDVGLQRIQYSVFAGSLTASKKTWLETQFQQIHQEYDIQGSISIIPLAAHVIQKIFCIYNPTYKASTIHPIHALTSDQNSQFVV